MNIDRKKIIIFTFIASLVAAITTTSLLYFTTRQETADPNSIKKRLANYTPKEPDKDSYNVLFMGYGGAGHSGGGLSDANVVANINTKNKIVTLIAIPRDLWVTIPVRSDLKEKHKINFAFAIGNDHNKYGLKETKYMDDHGGGNLAKDVLSEVLDLEIDYYAAIDFQRFINAIDELGGVTVDVPVSFTDKYFPIPGNEELLCGFSPEKMVEIHEKYSGFELEKQFECRYETLEFSKGPTKMDGATALKYLRSRHSETYGNDFARGERQQTMLVAIKEKLVSLNAIDKIDDFYAEFSRMVTTDIDDEVILEVLPKIGNPKEYTVNKLNITDQNYLKDAVSADGQYILIPKSGDQNFTEIQKYIKENI